MARVLTGLAAWLGGTALALGLAWFGAGMVLRNAAVSPGTGVISARPPAPAAGPPGESARSGPVGPDPVLRAAPASPGPSPAASPAAAGHVRSYTLSGGSVTLSVTRSSAALVTAEPRPGYSVQTWSGAGWLRVDFSSGPRVSWLIASWNGHPPAVTVTN